jgi:hypothetical protein
MERLEVTALWDIAPCSLVEADGEVNQALPGYTVQYPRRLSSSSSPPWEPQISVPRKDLEPLCDPKVKTSTVIVHLLMSRP